MRQLERNVLLNVIDRKWREHLYEMDYLKEGIGLRAMAQRDPLVEYQREGFDMFIGHARRDEGGVGRLPVQRHGRGGARDSGGAGGAGRRARAGWPSSPPQAAAQAQAQESGVATKERQQPRAVGACAPRELTTRRRR